MLNTRQKIFNYLLEEQSASVEGLSRVFKVTPANIRHHLSILVEQGSVKIIGKKAKLGKGRPSQLYTATQQSNQNNLSQLAENLLSTLLNTTPLESRNALLQDIARQMVSNTIIDTHNPTRRVYSSMRALNRMSYQAHWEAHSEHPRIMLAHCPYLSILEHHPEICLMDAYMLQELLDTPVEQTERLALNAKALPECIFLLTRWAS